MKHLRAPREQRDLRHSSSSETLGTIAGLMVIIAMIFVVAFGAAALARWYFLSGEVQPKIFKLRPSLVLVEVRR